MIRLAYPRFPIIRRRPEPVEGALRRLRRWPAATPDRTRPRVAGLWQLSGRRQVGNGPLTDAHSSHTVTVGKPLALRIHVSRPERRSVIKKSAPDLGG